MTEYTPSYACTPLSWFHAGARARCPATGARQDADLPDQRYVIRRCPIAAALFI